MTQLRESHTSNLIYSVTFVAAVSVLAIAGYMLNGWGFGDSLYMTVLTVFTVGFEEVHPVNTTALRAITIFLTVFGCTGMIYFAGALVQFIIFGQLQELLGSSRMTKEIETLENHVIICGFGRTGQMLAKVLTEGGARIVVVEPGKDRFEEAKALGYLCLNADAADEAVLKRAGIVRARTLASVVSSDPVNVFITLSARSLNKSIQIIARGEEISTERKLLQAGANSVVLPTHIGAEQIASMILFPAIAGVVQVSERRRQMELDLRTLGLEMQVVVAAEGSLFAGRTVEEIERRSENSFFIIATERAGGGTVERPLPSTKIYPGDGVTVIRRSGSGNVLRQLSEPLAPDAV